MTKRDKVVWVARLTVENPQAVLILLANYSWRMFDYGCIQLNRCVLTKKAG